MEPLIVVICFGLVGAALGVVLGRYVWPAAPGADPAALAASLAEAARFSQDGATLRSQVEILQAERRDLAESGARTAEDNARLKERAERLQALLDERDGTVRSSEARHLSNAAEVTRLSAEVARLEEREAALAANIDQQSRQVADRDGRAVALEVQRDAAINEAMTLRAEIAGLKEREAALNGKIEEQVERFEEMQRKLPVEFENIANRILRHTSTELSEKSEINLKTVLEPLRVGIQEFKGTVEQTYDAEKREVLSLREMIKQVVETSNSIGDQADSLAKALRGDSQRLGRWGEFSLERILETAGLTEGREYISQGRGLGLKSEDGGVQRPDVIIKLPENRAMVIDSKVPLAAYERLANAEETEEREAFRAEFLNDVKAHIDGLAGKRYQENDKLLAHECVLMFVPIDPALSAAADPDLFAYGWDRHVVLVGPGTLLMTMRTVASIWRYELQAQNAQQIARLAGDLCDKITLSLTDLQAVSDKMQAAMATHEGAVKRLSTGKGNALSIGERIKMLGVKTRRAAPALAVNGIPLMGADEEDTIEDATESNLTIGAVA